MITDLIILALAVASFFHSYHETTLFDWMKPLTKRLDSTIFMFLVSLTFASLYFFIPITTAVFIAAGAAYLILVLVVVLNRVWV